jgi:hypothetical protein
MWYINTKQLFLHPLHAEEDSSPAQPGGSQHVVLTLSSCSSTPSTLKKKVNFKTWYVITNQLFL